jgi:hypothetical protein
VRQIINWKTITEVITGIIYGLVSPLQSVLAYCNLQHENHDVVCQIGNLTLLVDKPIGASVRIPRELSRTFHHSLKKELSGKQVVEFVNLSSYLGPCHGRKRMGCGRGVGEGYWMWFK